MFGDSIYSAVADSVYSWLGLTNDENKRYRTVLEWCDKHSCPMLGRTGASKTRKSEEPFVEYMNSLLKNLRHEKDVGQFEEGKVEQAVAHLQDTGFLGRERMLGYIQTSDRFLIS